MKMSLQDLNVILDTLVASTGISEKRMILKNLKEKVLRKINGIKHGIFNIIKWSPILWNDRNWDHYYLYIILQFKLKQMEDLQRNHGIALNSKKYANQIKKCILILDRLIKDDYLFNALGPHEKKWGETKLNFKQLPKNKDLFEVIINAKKAGTEEKLKQEKKERTRLYKHANKMREQDLDLLFRNMKKYVEGWWDQTKFEISGEELKKYKEWYEEHNKSCPLYQNVGAIGGRLKYSFVPTGLGIVIVVRCSCGEELDLTDYENW